MDLDNGIVRDEATGLEWQKYTAPGVYTWGAAATYCENLTLGGHSDWRLPTIKELSFLVDSSRNYPAINTIYFPDTKLDQFYWSSSRLAEAPGNCWGVFFTDGKVVYQGAIYAYVRAVRGEPFNNAFIDNNDGTVTDTSTGLIWQKATAPGTYSWEQALDYCENLTLADKSDWRLPNRNELQSLVNYDRYNPAIDTTFFPDTRSCDMHDYCFYWTSTTYSMMQYAWTVDFGYGFGGGMVHFSHKSRNGYVRAVRGALLSPTLIQLTSFTVVPKAGRVIIQWSTAAEIDNAGYNVYRATTEDGEYIKINNALITAEGSATQGANYELIDGGLKNGKIYYYKLEDVDINGAGTMHGPVRAMPRWILGIFQ